MWFLYAFAVLAGALNAIQAGANATLSKTFIERANALGMDVSSFGSQFDAALQAQQVDDAIVAPKRIPKRLTKRRRASSATSAGLRT